MTESTQIDIADLSMLNHYIIQSMDIGILVADESQRLRLMNAAARHLLERNRPL
jgi:sensor histidine kinase regulating citrate/malate metabolism